MQLQRREQSIMKRTTLVVLTLSLAAAYQAPAQDADSSSRGVARLSLLAGEVSVRRGDAGEVVAAAVNAPLLGDDHVLTGDGARAEIQFDYAHFARLSSNSELRLADIENQKYLVRLARGAMSFRVLRNNEANAEISTPSIAIRPLKKGIYRVSVLEDGSTEVTVRSGEAEIFTPRGTQKLKSGKTLLSRGDPSDPEFQVANAPMADEWDRWNESRDRQLENSRNYDYVSQDITGAEDLDGHGRWVETEEYGNVWAPSASPDWAPYRNGRWTWVDYYGWNWMSYDPWGWAPYHYGRWINRPSIGWCWWPGRINNRHFWSPAQVAFFGWGGGGGLSIGVGFGNMGWVPLAPFETYYPWYGRGYYGGFRNGGRNNVTIVNNTNITNIYRNARHNNGITSVGSGQFGRGSVNNVRFNRNDIERASVVRGQLPMAPDAVSRRMSDRDSRVADSRGAGRGDDRFFSTRQATRVDRVPFENQRSAMQEVSRRTFGDNNTNDSGRRGGEVAGGGRGGDVNSGGRVGSVDRGASRGSDPGSGRGGDFGSGRGTEATSGRGGETGSGRVAGADNSDRGGWRRFGDSTSGSNTTDRSGGAGSGGRGMDSTGSRGDNTTRTERGDTGGWRRFGDSSPGATQSDRGAGRGSTIDSGSSPRRSDTGSWRRMDETSSPGRGGSTIDRGSSVDRGNSTNERRSIDRGTFDRGGSRSSDSSPRMSAPPVVRERSDDSGGRGGGFGSSRGESRQSSPRMEPAPRMERSTPRESAPGMDRSSPREPAPRMERSTPRESAPRMERSSPWESAPRMERSSPRESAPRMERSAPSTPRQERSAPPSNPGGGRGDGGGGRGDGGGGRGDGGGRGEGRGGRQR